MRHAARRLVATAAAVTLLAGCGVRADSSPHDVPEEFKPRLGVSSGTEATGADRIYLVEPGENQLLRSVSREAASPQALIETLLLGPNDTELEAEFSSAIPSNLRLNSVEEQGPVLYVDVSEELSQLSGPGLLQALAQLVYTGSEIDGIDQVQITVNGEVIAWPKADLESSTQPLRVYDYPGVVRTSQPDYPTVPAGGAPAT